MKLIFAGNLHYGGAVQVAVSFISELVSLGPSELKDIDVIVSSAIHNQLDIDLSMFNNYSVIDFFGAKFFSGKNNLEFFYDVCFVVFGPIYYSLNARNYVVGFAQPWIAYSDNDVYPKLSLHEKIKNKMRFFIQDKLFRRYQHLVVEHKHVKDALLAKGYHNNITVVSNSYASVFDYPDMWKKVNSPINTSQRLALGFIGCAYPHKNLAILNQVDSILTEKYGVEVDFLFTLTKEEMQHLNFDKKNNFYTVGRVSLAQCPSFYQLVDALIFPSQLECFSATPLEAMKMRKTVFASNYPFISEVCMDAGIYFDANDAFDIARVIHEGLNDSDTLKHKIELGSDIVNNAPTARQRALSYLEVLSSYNK
ncbi:glycosyltransferase [Motilimonas cestriensis]|uniref:Glycosyltransferase n=1 Tax=Motilimonas cestriensis TaxID=2742685 RepID=A0ABS8W521_9GAMM|nr:glycosyltransferase [Motilimonas cestriensis]MCE2594067.1 glycosyltransferase [Motilimonas cestriensis]